MGQQAHMFRVATAAAATNPIPLTEQQNIIRTKLEALSKLDTALENDDAENLQSAFDTINILGIGNETDFIRYQMTAAKSKLAMLAKEQSLSTHTSTGGKKRKSKKRKRKSRKSKKRKSKKSRKSKRR